MMEPTQLAQEHRPKRLSTFMKVSIAILSAVTIASISLLFIGDFEGKFERVFSTLALFTVFVLLTAFDTRRERNNEWYAPVALIANAYILGLLLVVIWITRYGFDLQFTILWKSAFVIVTTRVVMLGIELLLRVGGGKIPALTKWGLVTSIFGVLSLIMFTAPLGIEAFDIKVPQLYWKFSVATLILTALGLAITLLLSWYYRDGTKPAVQNVAPYVPGGGPQSEPQPELLPWPTFADGTPLPMLADGQPDFSALEEQAPKESEA